MRIENTVFPVTHRQVMVALNLPEGEPAEW